MQISHETIYRSLFIQTRGVLKKRLMAATRYGIMMLRFASTKAAYDKFRRPIEYPKIKY